MNPNLLKAKANEILTHREGESPFIEYKASEKQLDKILKTICAYGNNYYDKDVMFIFIGVEEIKDENGKGTPVLPIKGVEKDRLESASNLLKSLRSYTYPNVKYEVLANDYEGISYLLIVVPRQGGGPFTVTEKAEKDKKIALRPGRYIRYEWETRLAKIDEEYDLLRKFAQYHYSSAVNESATLDDLSFDYMKEYVAETSQRSVASSMSKVQIAESLHLIDETDSGGKHVKNYAILMFSDHPEEFVREPFVEVITDTFGSTKRMEAKVFKGPIWKQYRSVVAYISDYFIRTVTVRFADRMENKQISNFPFVAVEELVGNAIVHKNYEKGRSIQIYITDEAIDIINYNKPLPPLTLRDLNERTIFHERDVENPEIRDCFKALGIIESYGTGIKEAKQACADNGSPTIEYKLFEPGVDITSVRIPINPQYCELTNQKLGIGDSKLGIGGLEETAHAIIKSKGYPKKVESSLIRVADAFLHTTFSNADVASTLSCSVNSATNYIKRLRDECGLIEPVRGFGKGHYLFKK